jgi:hypothetical protein
VSSGTQTGGRTAGEHQDSGLLRSVQPPAAEAVVVKPIRPASALDSALRRLLSEIHEGLRHGYFDFEVACEITGNGRRRLTLRAGKNYQFLIPADECDGQVSG